MDRGLRRVALASLVGTTIEFYDLFLYGLAASLVVTGPGRGGDAGLRERQGGQPDRPGAAARRVAPLAAVALFAATGNLLVIGGWAAVLALVSLVSFAFLSRREPG